MINLLHAGFDTLEAAFHGRWSDRTLKQLEQAKFVAQERMGPVETEIGQAILHVEPTGGLGGYSFTMDTGPDGFKVWAKRGRGGGLDWSAKVKVRPGCFLRLKTLAAVEAEMLDLMRALGWQRSLSPEGRFEAISRVDFALDFDAEGFQPDPYAVSTKAATRGREEIDHTSQRRRCTYLRVGSVARRQIAIYNKSHEARAKRNFFWFDVWGLDRKDDRDVWRIETRAGKEILKEDGIRTFADMHRRLKALFQDSLVRVRLVELSDANISRCPDLPIWTAARANLAAALRGLLAASPDVDVAGDSIEQRKAAIDASFEGLCVSKAALNGVSDDPVALIGYLRSVVDNLARSYHANPKRLQEKHRKACERYGGLYCEGRSRVPDDGEGHDHRRRHM